ncbi:MAG: hypothetical protein CFE33_18460 [Pseudorhodobacter sp. PARRP1]|nr:MAG: hypothetical protein CFE33_18460 [Pseudorhodobacter sp. PARRP1]
MTKVRIKIETEFAPGERWVHEVGTLNRISTEASAEDFGLSLVEGNSIQKVIQRAVLRGQVEEISEIERAC